MSEADDYDKLSPEERAARDLADRKREEEEQAGISVSLRQYSSKAASLTIYLFHRVSFAL